MTEYAKLSNAELRRLEADRTQSAEAWCEIVAELARREHTKPVSAGLAASYSPPSRTRVVLSGIDVPFWDLVVIQVKIAIAAIPALLILVVVGAIAVGILASVGASLRR